MKHDNETPAHLRHRTSLCTTGERDYTNRKPYRTKAEKIRARSLARKGKDGAWHCPLVPLRYHTPAR